MTRAVALIVAVAVACAVALSRHTHHARRPQVLRPPGYARAVSANYKVLSPRQSRRLMAYAEDLRACLREHGVEVAAPRPGRTRIELPLSEGEDRREVVSRGVVCGDALGGPPAGASQQLRPNANAILVYLPRYCLLDPEVASGE
jgi:hypothetical protein